MKIKPTPTTIWKRPAYLPYVHPALTDEDIRRTEKQFGYTLPKEFVDILRVQNGGPIRFKIPDSVGDKIAGLGAGFPSVSSFHLEESQEDVDFSLDGLIPFDGDGHWYHCLDFRCDAGCPAVSYIDVECNSQNKVADTFADFLDQMELDLENERVLGSVANIDDARNRLETLFKSKFENRISNIGVSFLTCQTGKEWDECFWISSNVVAHGYSGDGEESFEFKGEALLFPELPEHAVIFQAPSSRMDRYSSQLRDAGYELVEIEDATTP